MDKSAQKMIVAVAMIAAAVVLGLYGDLPGEAVAGMVGTAAGVMISNGTATARTLADALSRHAGQPPGPGKGSGI